MFLNVMRRAPIILEGQTNDMAEKDKLAELLESNLVVINVGLEGFASDLRVQGIEVVQVEWVPPAGGNPKLAALLSKLGS